MDLDTTSWDDEEWELCNDDGFVYKRKKRRLDPASVAQISSTTDVGQEEAAEKQRRERKRKTLIKLRAKYQREIDQWDSLSNALRAMEERAHQLQREQQEAQKQAVSLASPSTTTRETDSGGVSLVDELLLQVEAQEAIIHDVSNLCDIAEAMCDKQEKQFKQSLFNLPIWASPDELMKLLCDE
ncbi:hypothetical protein L6164_008966 [Bauhinia variegata]|uniref:Uncharacterized protein n=1 Tax=Bauhinia variegata TaxID=167791 RepID=A0ACB9PI83_BAUVA|nr:hypothetical protein L6164_008966 [Bauhinia variegata]